jgi:hypothetical protein
MYIRVSKELKDGRKLNTTFVASEDLARHMICKDVMSLINRMGDFSTEETIAHEFDFLRKAMTAFGYGSVEIEMEAPNVVQV